jgi:hypothetical protein
MIRFSNGKELSDGEFVQLQASFHQLRGEHDRPVFVSELFVENVVERVYENNPFIAPLGVNGYQTPSRDSCWQQANWTGGRRTSQR